MINLRDLMFPDKFKKFFALHHIKLLVPALAQNTLGVFNVGGDYIFFSIKHPQALGEFAAELAPGPDDLVVRKRRYNCFLGTELDLLLKALRIDTLVVTGVSSDVCVHWTVGEAFQRDFHVRVLEDCVAGTSLEDHEASLLIMRNLVSAGERFTSAELTDALAREAAVAGGV